MYRIFLALSLCCTGLVTEPAWAYDARRCADLKPPVPSAQVVNAIGEGRIQLLVDCGLDPNQEIPIAGDRITPLQLVASMENVDLIRQVIRAGADPNFGGSGEDPLPPLEVALSRLRYESAGVLLSLGARADYALATTKVNALMSLAFDDRQPFRAGPMIDLLIKKGARVDAADYKGNTPLHWGARSGNAPYVGALLKHGANACLRNAKGERPADVVRADNPTLKQTLARSCSQD